MNKKVTKGSIQVCQVCIQVCQDVMSSKYWYI